MAYPQLKEHVLTGQGNNEEILLWCFQQGPTLNNNDLWIWNSFISKVGWRDVVHPYLEKFKQDSGLAHRHDILTSFVYLEVD